MIVIATVKIGNNNGLNNKIYNNKKNKNSNNNVNNDNNVRFLMTKAMVIMIIEELVTITKVTVIMMTYRWNSIEKKNILTSQTLNGNIKTNTKRRKSKTMEHITIFVASISGMDRWEILISSSGMS